MAEQRWQALRIKLRTKHVPAAPWPSLGEGRPQTQIAPVLQNAQRHTQMLEVHPVAIQFAQRTELSIGSQLTLRRCSACACQDLDSQTGVNPNMAAWPPVPRQLVWICLKQLTMPTLAAYNPGSSRTMHAGFGFARCQTLGRGWLSLASIVVRC